MFKIKIGILTFHAAVNYGAYLQSFSLSNEIKKRFPECEVEIIDYISPKEKRKIYLNILREMKYRGFSSMMNEITKVRIFKKSKKYLMLSKKSICTDDIEALYKYINNNYDCLIIGSDAVLNWKQNGYPSAYFPDKCVKIPVLGYAMSAHGLDFYNLNDEQKEYCKNSFSRFSSIGVRDENTRKFVELFNSDKETYHLCDPTFFIDMDKVDAIASGVEKRLKNKYGFDINSKYIVLMLMNDKISKAVYDRYSKEYKIISLFKSNKYADCFLYDLNPFEWIEVLKSASVVFTQYFHGNLLSLRNNTGVVVIDTAKEDKHYESKLYDTMYVRLGLPDLYFKKSDAENNIDSILEVSDRIIKGEFNKVIFESFDKERKTSEAFFEKLNDVVKK